MNRLDDNPTNSIFCGSRGHHAGPRFRTAAAIAATWLLSVSSVEAVDVLMEENGYQFEASAGDELSTASLTWRLVGIPSAGVDAITPLVNGSVVDLSSIQLYPYSGAITTIFFLVDSSYSGQESMENVLVQLSSLLAQTGEHHQVFFASFDSELHWYKETSVDPDEFLDAVLALDQMGNNEDPSEALLGAIRALGSQAATRKAVFIFSDRLNSLPATHEKLISLAAESGVSIYPISQTSSDDVPSEGLERIAFMTGGMYISTDVETGQLPSDFLLFPYLKLDFGGKVSVDLANFFKFPLGGTSELEFNIVYGENISTVSLPVSLQKPTMKEAWTYLTNSENRLSFMLFIAVILLSIICIILAVRIRRVSAY